MSDMSTFTFVPKNIHVHWKFWKICILGYYDKVWGGAHKFLCNKRWFFSNVDKARKGENVEKKVEKKMAQKTRTIRKKFLWHMGGGIRQMSWEGGQVSPLLFVKTTTMYCRIFCIFYLTFKSVERRHKLGRFLRKLFIQEFFEKK